jgi:hypothetical protein
MGAWDGDWAQRIDDFARSQGHAHIWHYLRAHPGVPLTTVADTIGSAAAIQIHRLVLQHCLTNREMGALIRDLMARSIREALPKGWGEANDFKHARATGVGILPEPYRTLAREMGTSLLEQEVPPRGWLPESGDDEILLRVHARAVESLPQERRQILERGAIEPQPGDAYWAKVEPIWKAISIYEGGDTFLEQFQRVQGKLGDLLAAHWCQSEVRNGGFAQFFGNSTGVLAPEAAAGFRAIGMPRCAAVIAEAMSFFGRPYPREREEREAALTGEARPFAALDDQFYDLLSEEAGGFAVAADKYASAPPTHRPPREVP